MNKNRLYNLLFLVILGLFCFAHITVAQTKGTSISATIVDEEGNPLSGVTVLAPKGVRAITGDDGTFQIVVSGKKSIVVQKDGYDSRFINIADFTPEITLKKSPFLASEKDVIKTGFSTKYRRDMVGAVSTITPKDHQTYDNTQRVKDYIDGLLLGVKGTSNIRGLGNALFVIDGVVGRNPDMLNMDEVDQITVLKDASAVALYGNQARNGVIVINTKRGEVNNRQARVNIRYGIKDPIALPKYLGSAQYMELFNEARINDAIRRGLTEADIADQLYSAEDIENFRSSTNRYKYPNVDFYTNEYLRSFANMSDITTEFSGGDDKTRYYVNMGWNYSQSLVELNPDANVGTNRFNVRGNIDFKINDWISSSLDGVAIVNQNKSALRNLLVEGTTFKPNLYAPLLPASMIDTTGNPGLAAQLQAAKQFDGMLLGGTQQYQNGPIASVVAGGYRKSIYRMTQFNNSIDFDLSMITEGLSAKTYLSFDFYDSYNVSISNKYSVYEPVWENDTIVGLNAYGDPDQKDLTENVSTNDYTARYGAYGLLNYKKAINDHSIDATFLAYLSSRSSDGVIQKDKNAHLGLQLLYDYKKKLYADFSGAYINSIKLPKGNRGGFSPTLGLGYILSKEKFMQDVDFINFLKLKATAGIIKSDLGIDKYYLYNETFSNGGSFGWADGQSSNQAKVITQGANPNMTFEERIDLNLGFDSYLMNSLWVEFNYFKSDIDKQLTTLNTIYPSYYNTFRPMDNYNKNSYQGFELGMDYQKSFNDLTLKVGGNIMYVKSEVVKRDEVYEDAYQYRTGKPTNAIFGLVDDGFYSESDFSTDADGKLVLNEGMPVPAFGAVIPGDIKYVDQNNDGIIDNKDQVYMGQAGNPWSYGLDLKLKYKGVSLFVLGSGQFGGEANLSNNYYWVDGNDKYSEIVLGRWTPETANSATFPRLSAQKDSHNMQRSTFWMYNNSFFRIQRAQLTYEFSKKLCDKIGMKNLSVNVAGINLLQIAENKDIRELTVGGNPQFRTFTLGLRTSF